MHEAAFSQQSAYRLGSEGQIKEELNEIDKLHNECLFVCFLIPGLVKWDMK